MRLIVAISGGSGVHLGLKFLEYLPKSVSPYLIITDAAKEVFKNEYPIFLNSDISAPMASGSFNSDGMVIIPCSMNTLAKISVGIADNLVTRSASVILKERKRLLIAPRELPFGTIALENMLKLSKMGVIIAPPILGYYSEINSIEEMEKFIIGKWFDSLNIKNSIYKRWKSEE